MLFCYKLDFFQANFTGLDYSLDHHNRGDDHQPWGIGHETSADHNNGMIDYMLNNPHHHHHQQQQQISSSSGFAPPQVLLLTNSALLMSCSLQSLVPNWP
ncbi:putative DNA binding protein [Corchorus olitorius]|uniref:DNA binding protein n=1 Tax=Corchorus olitorius TaxID=93759 RepID=A0A1R3GS91_9ROSI|nr:putative DNA binding protein [Corchorus olitorius]